MIGKNTIPNKKRGEEVILHLRRHRFVFILIALMFVVLYFIPLGIYLLITNLTPEFLEGTISQPLSLVVVFSYYLVILLFNFTMWTETYLDVWTVTTERIINREQNGLFNRVVSELELHRIQDVTAEQKGFFATILHYGNVYVQTAGKKERFVFEQIPNPYRVAKMIQKLDEKAKKNQNAA